MIKINQKETMQPKVVSIRLGPACEMNLHGSVFGITLEREGKDRVVISFRKGAVTGILLAESFLGTYLHVTDLELRSRESYVIDTTSLDCERIKVACHRMDQ